MSVADKLAELASDIGDCYGEVQSKGGTIPQNKNTNNLATAIGSIPSGSTPIGQIAITQNGTYDVTDYASASVKTPVESGWATLVTGQETDLYSDSIISLNGTNAFNVRTYITGVNLPNCTSIVSSALGYMPIRYAILPKLRQTSNNLFYSTPRALEYVILNYCTYINQNFGNSNPNFNILMMGYDGVCGVHGTNFLSNTPFRNGDGGTVYVPRKWVADYQNATNWSALESTTFAAIEDNIEFLESLGADVDEWKVAE